MPGNKKMGLAALPVPAKPQDLESKKMAAAKDFVAGFNTFGIAGEVGLRMFANGQGVKFKFDKDGTPVAEAMPEKDKNLYFDNDPVS
jgi:hypothetical protein